MPAGSRPWPAPSWAHHDPRKRALPAVTLGGEGHALKELAHPRRVSQAGIVAAMGRGPGPERYVESSPPAVAGRGCRLATYQRSVVNQR